MIESKNTKCYIVYNDGREIMKYLKKWSILIVICLFVFSVMGFKTYQILKPKITVGATSTPHALVLENIKEDFEKETGYELAITTMSTVATANTAMFYDSLDASYIQHRVSLEKFNEDRNQDFVEIATVHIEPFGLYSKRTKDIQAIPDNTQIIVPNTSANQGRALVLLEASGLLKFKEGTNVAKLSLQTYEAKLEANPKHISFKAIDPSLLVGAYDGNDQPFVFINANYALQAKLSPTSDAIIHEDVKKSEQYINVLATRKEHKERKELKILAKLLESQKTAQFIDHKFNHEIIAVHL